ncbi:hypothetical protein JZU68_07450, partial [bacterium]|nr:hypothetical protein [bacterium]
KPREDQKEQLNVLLFSANNLLTIVNDILDYNKIEAGKINFEYIDMDLVKVFQDLLSGIKAVADEKKSKPYRWLIVLISTSSAFLLAIMYLLFAEKFTELKKK